MDIRNSYSDQKLDPISDIVHVDKGNFYTILIKIEKVEVRVTKFNKEMTFIKIYEEENSESVCCFNYSKQKDKIVESNGIVGVIKADARYEQLIEWKEHIKSEQKSNSYWSKLIII